MDLKQIQTELFNQVKMRLAPNLSLVDSVADVLNISTDSAYRRIRGEKAIDLLETKLLCDHFGLSLDALLGSQGSRIMFTSNHQQPADFDFLTYLKGNLKSMQYFHSFPQKKLYYECKDIPIFHHFHSRELAAFKHFFWRKFLFEPQVLKHQKFSFDDYPDAIFEVGRQMAHLYYTMPSVEFWNIESVSSTLRQIDFLHATGSFQTKDDASAVYQSVGKLLHDIERMSAQGEKPPLLDNDPQAIPGTFEVFNNEVVLGGNTILAITGSGRMVFLNHSVFNYVYTADLAFGMYIQHYFENLARSSTQISQVSEVERNSFFRIMQDMVQERIAAL